MLQYYVFPIIVKCKILFSISITLFSNLQYCQSNPTEYKFSAKFYYLKFIMIYAWIVPVSTKGCNAKHRFIITYSSLRCVHKLITSINVKFFDGSIMFVGLSILCQASFSYIITYLLNYITFNIMLICISRLTNIIWC